eukprot:2170349-Rhodomonas_salina.3
MSYEALWLNLSQSLSPVFLVTFALGFFSGQTELFRMRRLADSKEECWVEAEDVGQKTILIPPTSMAFHNANQPQTDGGQFDEEEYGPDDGDGMQTTKNVQQSSSRSGPVSYTHLTLPTICSV